MAAEISETEDIPELMTEREPISAQESLHLRHQNILNRIFRRKAAPISEEHLLNSLNMSVSLKSIFPESLTK